MKNTKNRVEDNSEMSFGNLSIVRDVKFLYAKIKNHQLKNFTKKMEDNGFYTRTIFEKGVENTKNGFILLFVFQPTEGEYQLIEGQEVFRNIEKKEVGKYAAYGYISLKNIQGQIIRVSNDKYDLKRSRISTEIMECLEIELEEEMKGFWDSNLWSKYATSMSEEAIPMSIIQQILNERTPKAADTNTRTMVRRCLDNYYKHHYATAS